MDKLNQPSATNEPKWKAWFKRLGLGAFLFFLLKGIGWLVLFYFGFELAGC